MTIYEDYVNYMEEYQQLIEKLQSTHSNVLITFMDVIIVCDYIYQLYTKDGKLDDDLAELFEVGFGYLTNVISDIQTYISEYYQNDIFLFNQYSSYMFYLIYLDDLKSFLDVNELLDNEKKNQIDDLSNMIDQKISFKEEITKGFLEYLNDHINSLIPIELDYKPVYLVYSLIVEELHLY